MPIIRVKKNDDFTVVSNVHIKDKRLSLRAKGLMTLMLSLPDEWDFSVRGLCALSDDGYYATSVGLQELEKFGYLVRSEIRIGGKFRDIEYTLYEIPQSETPKSENPITVKPITENPQSEKPQSEKPQSKNQDNKILNNKILINQELNNNTLTRIYAPESVPEEKPKKARFVKPTVDEVRAYIVERGSSVDAQAWYDHYESNGWMVGKSPMKDWKAAVRTWERNGIQPTGSGHRPSCNPQKSYLTDEQWNEFYDTAVAKELSKYDNQ